MNNKINLILIAFLLGDLITALPNVATVSLFVGASLLLFLNFDKWKYERFSGGVR